MTLSRFRALFQAKLDAWTPSRAAYREVFTEREIGTLERSCRKFDSSNRRVVFLSFENRHVSLGGLAAVTQYLPASLQEHGERVAIVTPFHKNHPAIRKALRSKEIQVLSRNQSFRLGQRKCPLTVYVDRGTAPPPSYLVDVETFFTASHNPYAYADHRLLLADALAFSCAVPEVLRRIGLTRNVLLHANDWETALVAYTSKRALAAGELGSARTVLTLHNAFDSWLAEEDARSFIGTAFEGKTVLQGSIPFVDGPLTTVSTPYAHELCHDPLQTGFFCNHLQAVFSNNPPVGIENGIFGTGMKAIGAAALAQAKKGNFAPLLATKDGLRRDLFRIIATAFPDRAIGSLRFAQSSGRIPLLFMTGRMDAMQKGFDVIFNAFARLKKGSAKLLFSPSNPAEGSLDFFTEFVRRFEGDIAIWPFRIPDDIYRKCLMGVSFLVMPSLYEPFGAATEGYLHATPVIARATGGLWAQVNSCTPLSVPSFYSTLFGRASRRERGPTGVLYRETGREEETGELWRALMNTPVEERIHVPLYRTMVDAAYEALRAAARLYRQPHEYARAILNGTELAAQFDWTKATLGYKSVYDRASQWRLDEQHGARKNPKNRTVP